LPPVTPPAWGHIDSHNYIHRALNATSKGRAPEQRLGERDHDYFHRLLDQWYEDHTGEPISHGVLTDLEEHSKLEKLARELLGEDVP